MGNLLQLSTYGMKNLEKMITIDFSNATLSGGTKKFNNVKGIFGYNGSGKSAIINSVYFYRNIVCDDTFLLQNSTKLSLNKLINYKLKEFFISMVFEYGKNSAIKHTLKLSKDPITGFYIISEERLEILEGRTLNEQFKTIISKKNDQIDINKNYNIPSFGMKDFKNKTILFDLFTLNASKVKASISSETNTFYKEIKLLFPKIFSMVIHFCDENIPSSHFMGVDQINSLYRTILNSKDIYNCEFNVPVDNVYSNDIEAYKKQILRLEKFIKLFKPELKHIKLDIFKDRDIYHIKKLFVYENYEIELTYESSGIKQLVSLFGILESCACGNIVFIDEVDTNINPVYFAKLISFFMNYGKGQLIFTSHNLEAMNSLKSKSKSIIVLGADSNVDTWVGHGNKSPIASYVDGYFRNSPMNIEDFDFIDIFLGDDK